MSPGCLNKLKSPCFPPGRDRTRVSVHNTWQGNIQITGIFVGLTLPGTLRGRLVLAFSLMQVLAVTLLGFYLVYQAARTEIDSQHTLAQNLMALAEPNVLSMLETRDSPGLKKYLDNLIMNTTIAGVFVSNRPGTLIYSLDQDEPPPNAFVRLFVSELEANVILTSSLYQNDVSRGSLEIKLSSKPITERLTAILVNNLLMLVGLLVFSLSITWWVISGFTTPLKHLVRIAAHIGRGDWRRPIATPNSGYREIQDLGNALTESARIMSDQISSLQDTQEKLLTNEQQLRSLVDNMREAMFELDKQGKISFLNPAWQQLTGYNHTDSFGKTFADFLPNNNDRELFLAGNLKNLDINNIEMEIRSAGSKPIRVEIDAHATVDHHGELLGVVGRFHDITQRYELTRTLEQHRRELFKISITDELTGLYNRRHFEKILEKKLPKSLDEGKSLCLALVDIDGFKFINDTYGHPVGDNVLKTAANLLRSFMRTNDMIARLAGDEFAMVFPDTEIEEARGICQAALDSIQNARVRLTVGHLQLRASIGMSIAPFHGQSVQELIGAADVALYQAKRRHRGQIEVLSIDISQGIMEVFSRGFELRNAIVNGDIQPTFQPITDLASGEPIAYEVLANMQRGELLVPASEFIMVAEDLGLVREIDLSVIGRAIEIAPPQVELFLNISLISFNDENFGKELLKLLKPACEAGRPVTIEITERETINLTETLLDDIQALRDAGCKLALDDFGQGYSTYNYLRQFRPEYLKIDGSFVEHMLDSHADHTIIEHIHELALSFGAVCIAESIENETLRDAVMQLGVKCGQGYHYARPAIAEKVFTKSDSAA